MHIRDKFIRICVIKYSTLIKSHLNQESDEKIETYKKIRTVHISKWIET
jgi:hypothetical protein